MKRHFSASYNKQHQNPNKMITSIQDAIFHAKKILLVDDDMRNIFALSKLQEREIK
jgi:hypothetical protein